jgi:hypothetical protein
MTESRTQVAIGDDGVLEMHDNVLMQANTAGTDGGAVSLPFEIGSHLPVLVLQDTFGKGRFDSGKAVDGS